MEEYVPRSEMVTILDKANKGHNYRMEKVVISLSLSTFHTKKNI
jgi:hypothetical protein